MPMTIARYPGKPSIDEYGNQWHSSVHAIGFDGREFKKKRGVCIGMRACALCGEMFSTNVFSGSGKNKKYCSTECGSKVGSRAKQRKDWSRLVDLYLSNPLDRCFSCGQMFRPLKGQIVCSSECGHEFGRWSGTLGQGKEYPHSSIGYCDTCGKVIHGSRKRCKSCKPEHRRQYGRQQRRTGQQISSRLKERFSRYNTQYDKGISWRTIAAERGMRCALCGIKCSTPSSYNLDDEVTLDHITTLSLVDQGSFHSSSVSPRTIFDHQGSARIVPAHYSLAL